MKKIFFFVSIVLLVIVLVVAGILLTRNLNNRNDIPKEPFVSFNGKILSTYGESETVFSEIVKLSILAHAESIIIRKARGEDIPMLKITYWHDSEEELKFNPEKGLFDIGETSVAFIDTFEAILPAGVEVNIRQKSSNITLSGLVGGTIFINSDYLTLSANELQRVNSLSITTKNGSISLRNSSVDKLNINAFCGELSGNSLDSGHAQFTLKNMNSLFSNCNFGELKADVDSGYLQIQDSKVKYLNNISKRNILWLLANDISKVDFSFDNANVNLKDNLMNKISASGSNSIVRTDYPLPEKFSSKKDNTIVYSPKTEENKDL